MQVFPLEVQLIGDEVAIIWIDKTENFYTSEYLRQKSPSAENIGEKDILGNQYGGNTQRDFSKVKVIDWEFVGRYGIRFIFSDRHATGIYSWDYLKTIAS